MFSWQVYFRRSFVYADSVRLSVIYGKLRFVFFLLINILYVGHHSSAQALVDKFPSIQPTINDKNFRFWTFFMVGLWWTVFASFCISFCYKEWWRMGKRMIQMQTSKQYNNKLCRCVLLYCFVEIFLLPPPSIQPVNPTNTHTHTHKLNFSSQHIAYTLIKKILVIHVNKMNIICVFSWIGLHLAAITQRLENNLFPHVTRCSACILNNNIRLHWIRSVETPGPGAKQNAKCSWKNTNTHTIHRS